MGLSIPVGQALLAHPLNYDMVWSATVKEATYATIFTELPAIFRKFRYTFVLCFACIAMMLTFAFLPVMEYQVLDWVSIVPLALVVGGHILYPFLLKCVLPPSRNSTALTERN